MTSSLELGLRLVIDFVQIFTNSISFQFFATLCRLLRLAGDTEGLSSKGIEDVLKTPTEYNQIDLPDCISLSIERASDDIGAPAVLISLLFSAENYNRQK